MAGTPRLAPIVEAGAIGKSHNPVSGQVRVLLRGARGPLVAGQIHPDSIPYGKINDPLPDRVDDTRAVLIRSHLRERRRCAVARAKARLPVGGVDAGDDRRGYGPRQAPVRSDRDPRAEEPTDHQCVSR